MTCLLNVVLWPPPLHPSTSPTMWHLLVTQPLTGRWFTYLCSLWTPSGAHPAEHSQASCHEPRSLQAESTSSWPIVHDSVCSANSRSFVRSFFSGRSPAYSGLQLVGRWWQPPRSCPFLLATGRPAWILPASAHIDCRHSASTAQAHLLDQWGAIRLYERLYQQGESSFSPLHLQKKAVWCLSLSKGFFLYHTFPSPTWPIMCLVGR